MSWLLPLSFLLPGLCMMDRHPFYHAAAAAEQRDTVEGWFIKPNQILLLSAALSFLYLSVFLLLAPFNLPPQYCMLYISHDTKEKERSRRFKKLLRWDTPCYKWTPLSVFSSTTTALINFSMTRKEVAVFVFFLFERQRRREEEGQSVLLDGVEDAFRMTVLYELVQGHVIDTTPWTGENPTWEQQYIVRNVAVIAGGVLWSFVWKILYVVVDLLSKAFFSKYKSLNSIQRVDWTSR